MAEIQFERRGRPLWLVVLIALVLGGGGYFEWASCAAIQHNRTLAPTPAPATAPAVAPGVPASRP